MHLCFCFSKFMFLCYQVMRFRKLTFDFDREYRKNVLRCQKSERSFIDIDLQCVSQNLTNSGPLTKKLQALKINTVPRDVDNFTSSGLTALGGLPLGCAPIFYFILFCFVLHFALNKQNCQKSQMLVVRCDIQVFQRRHDRSEEFYHYWRDKQNTRQASSCISM